MTVRMQLLMLVALLTTLGCTRHQVTRVYDGVPQQERFIHPAAYAAFLRGTEWEARGQLKSAIAELEQAAAFDGDNLAARARLIGLYCRSRNLAAAERAYREVLERDPERGDAHYAWARCQQQREGDHDLLAAARRAAMTAPGDERAVLLLAEQLLVSKQRAEALVWLRALLRHQPGSVAGWRALKSAAEAAADETQAPWARLAERRLKQLSARNRPRSSEGEPNDALPAAKLSEAKLLSRVDRALLSGRVSQARQLVRRAGKPPAVVALRALAVGDRQLAHREASLRVGAEPDNFGARVVLALVLDEQGQPEQAANLLYAAAAPRRLDAISRRVMARLLARHVGPEAAAAWSGAALLAPPPIPSSPASPHPGKTP